MAVVATVPRAGGCGSQRPLERRAFASRQNRAMRGDEGADPAHADPSGPVFIGHRLGMHPSRVLRRHRVPLLREVDPVTGTVIRASRRSPQRDEHAYPGSLVHIDVKKLGCLSDGGRWGAHGRTPWTNGKAERLNRTLAAE